MTRLQPPTGRFPGSDCSNGATSSGGGSVARNSTQWRAPHSLVYPSAVDVAAPATPQDPPLEPHLLGVVALVPGGADRRRCIVGSCSTWRRAWTRVGLRGPR